MEISINFLVDRKMITHEDFFKILPSSKRKGF